ncbi:MAG: FecR domain-containing protein [Pseudomonadota bacterium]
MAQSPSPKSQRIMREARQWMFALDAPEASDKVHADFEAWLDIDPDHATLFEHVKNTGTALNALKRSDIPKPLRYSVFDTVQIYLSDVVAAMQSRKVVIAGGIGALAACAALGMVLIRPQTPQMMPTQPKVAAYDSQIGEIKPVMLSDGSTVTLGAHSSIEARFYEDKRIVKLNTGVAHFDVAKDIGRPFTVKAGDLEATALGTAFDVQIRGDDFSVSVAKGQVKVVYPFILDGKRMGMQTNRDLSMGQQVTATSEDGLQKVLEVSIKSMAAWRSGQLVYRGISLTNLVADLNRYSATKIEIDAIREGLTDYRFRGVFPTPDIDEVLARLASTYPVMIDRSIDGKIIVRKRNPS